MRTLLPILVALTLIARQSSQAQESTPTPVPDSQAVAPSENSSQTNAWLRVWIMIPPDIYPPIVGDQPSFKDRLSVVTNDEGEKPRFLIGNAIPFGTSGYTDLPAKECEIRLVRQAPGGAATDLARVKANLKPGMFATVVAEKVNGNYTLSMIDDTPKAPEPAAADQPPPPPPKQILFYNFLPEFSSDVTSEDPAFSKQLAYGSPQIATNLPSKVFYLHMPRKNGKRTSTSNVEIDMQLNDSLSFLVVKDFYGRVVAKVIPNAKLD